LFVFSSLSFFILVSLFSLYLSASGSLSHSVSSSSWFLLVFFLRRLCVVLRFPLFFLFLCFSLLVFSLFSQVRLLFPCFRSCSLFFFVLFSAPFLFLLFFSVSVHPLWLSVFSLVLAPLWPSLAFIKPEDDLCSCVCASRSWGTNAFVSLRRNRGIRVCYSGSSFYVCFLTLPVLLRFLFSLVCVFGQLSIGPPVPCSSLAFYRARELAKQTNPLYSPPFAGLFNQSTRGIVGKGRGPRFGPKSLQLFQLPCWIGMKKMSMTVLATVPFRQKWTFLFWPLNFWNLTIGSLISLIKQFQVHLSP
jgi:hypothetical protein